MPRRSILSATERESLLALPDAKDELIRQYTFNETDLSHATGRGGAGDRASPDRPVGDAATARQNYRAADGSW